MCVYIYVYIYRNSVAGVLFEALERADVKDADRGVAAARVQQLLVCEQTQHLPRQSLRRNRQESIPPQGSGFQKWRSSPDTLFNEFTCSNTLAWWSVFVNFTNAGNFKDWPTC